MVERIIYKQYDIKLKMNYKSVEKAHFAICKVGIILISVKII